MIRSYIKLVGRSLVKWGALQQKDLVTCASLKPCRTIFELPNINCSINQTLRHKSKRSRNKQESESDRESSSHDEFVDKIQDKNTKILNVAVTSLRVDAIVKGALGIARNKVETLFYESKIRVNGQKLAKKGAAVHPGDEIDLLKGPDLKNPNFMNVARIEVLSIKPGENDESIVVKVRRCKSLTVESYD